MLEILKVYAPLQSYELGKLALKQKNITSSAPLLHKRENRTQYVCHTKLNNFPFSFMKPLDFLLSKDTNPNSITYKKISGEFSYVSLCDVDRWADTEGFHKVTGILQYKGLSYWKNGTYFSQTQLLMHLNRLRYEHHLNPLALIEEERDIPA